MVRGVTLLALFGRGLIEFRVEGFGFSVLGFRF